ncbi:hypothetical protein JTE90_024213 [Oedothorax gibbosus]|uniref:Uncharacterized protein n=1 Tax=Oedothorax gibbosus TaxID=931172 RepID=A0AAV6U8V3_9ARAC|nr:hypothetical protein JTE90_024213 [Oedothorax gibbosus]
MSLEFQRKLYPYTSTNPTSEANFRKELAKRNPQETRGSITQLPATPSAFRRVFTADTFSHKSSIFITDLIGAPS